MLCVKELSWLEILALLERRESLGGLREAEQHTQARTHALSAGAPAIANATTNMHADKRSRQHAHTRTLTHQTAYASTSIHRHSQTKHPQGIFEEVYAPLVDQIENDLGGSDAYEARVDDDTHTHTRAHTRKCTPTHIYTSTHTHTNQTPQGIFEEVYAPLVDQIENDLGGSDAYEARVDDDTHMHTRTHTHAHTHTHTQRHRSIHAHTPTLPNQTSQGVFEEVYAPLVDQIENDLGGSDAYEARVDEYVVPSIAQLAMAVHDDAMWKKLNHSVLLKTRHHETQVRLLESLVARLFASAFFPFNGIAQPQCPAQGKARQDTRE